MQDLPQAFESQIVGKDESGRPKVEQDGRGSTEAREGGRPQSSEVPEQEVKQSPSSWDPEIIADCPGLARRPGLTRFMEFREMKEPPGMVFDIPTLSLSVAPSFPQNLHFHPPSHHKAKPWIQKACLTRAQAWSKIYTVDISRVKHPKATKNRTARRHRGTTFAHHILIQNLASAVQKHSYDPSYGQWAKEMGPSLPERLHAHLDGIAPKDVSFFIEDHFSYIKSHPGRIMSSIWVAINASYCVSMRACNDLASGNQPNPDWDVLTPVLEKFADWLQDTYANQHPRGQMLKANNHRVNKAKESEETSQLYLPLIRDMMPPGHDIPVVFAFRHRYLLFILKGGVAGKLVAQYEGHWLPLAKVSKYDADEEVNRMQLDRLRAGADEYAITKTSGGIPLSEDFDDES